LKILKLGAGLDDPASQSIGEEGYPLSERPVA